MKTSLKAGFAQIFSCWPKNLSCPKFGGGPHSPSPPGPYVYVLPGSPRNLLPCAKRKDLCTNLAAVTKQPFGKNTNESVNNSVKTHCKTARWAYIERLASDLKKKWKPKPFWNFVKYKRRRTNKLVFLKIDIAVLTDLHVCMPGSGTSWQDAGSAWTEGNYVWLVVSYGLMYFRIAYKCLLGTSCLKVSKVSLPERFGWRNYYVLRINLN